MNINLSKAEEYFDSRFVELGKILAADASPWIFICLAAMIEYLSKMSIGTGKESYFKFIKQYMPNSYRDFQYKCGCKDLPEQMYYILRCGGVHAFSFIPDQQSLKNGARHRSIVLNHDMSDGGHIKQYTKGVVTDACCLNAHKFMEDVRCAYEKMFVDAQADQTLRNKLLTQISTQPPISMII